MTSITLKDKLVSRLQSRLLLSCYILLIILLKKKKETKLEQIWYLRDKFVYHSR